MIHPYNSFEPILFTTTHVFQIHEIEKYHGMVFGEVIIGANVFKDFLASITDVIVPVRLSTYLPGDYTAVTLWQKR
jgi:hypothetical protein